MTQLAFDLDDQGPVMATVYTRCPSCQLLGPPQSMEWVMSGPTGPADLERPATVCCLSCGHSYPVRLRTDPHVRDVVHTCRREERPGRPACTHRSPVPAAADTVCCTACGLYAPGPRAAADPERAQLKDVTETLHGIELRGTVQEARARRRRR